MSATTPKIVWHYTYSHRIGEILRSRVLLPPRMIPGPSQEYPHHFHGQKGYESDRKLLLFSANPVWEPASYRGWSENGVVKDLTCFHDYAERGITVYRIGVETSILKPWVRLKTIAQMPRDMAKSLEKHARDVDSNPYDWWGTLFPVPSEKWHAVEVLVGGEWQPLPEWASSSQAMKRPRIKESSEAA